jgi:DDE superfamily endonuclease
MLLSAFLAITAQWRLVFVQHRLLLRAQRQALGALLVLGRASLARILWTNGREQHSWSAEYFLHSRAQWDPQALFAPLLKAGLSWCPGRLVGVAVDDTRIRKTGRCIAQAALPPRSHVAAVSRQPDVGPAFSASLAAVAIASHRPIFCSCHSDSF